MRLAPDAYVPLSVRAAVAEAIKAADAGSMPLEWAQMHAALDVLADADRIARPLPTRDEIVDVLSGWPIGTGYYQTTVGTDEARDMAYDIIAMLKGTQQ